MKLTGRKANIQSHGARRRPASEVFRLQCDNRSQALGWKPGGLGGLTSHSTFASLVLYKTEIYNV